MCYGIEVSHFSVRMLRSSKSHRRTNSRTSIACCSRYFLESLLVGSRSIVTGLRHELEVTRENVKVPSQLDTDYSFFEGNRQPFFSQLLKAREMHTPKRFDSIFLQ